MRHTCEHCTTPYEIPDDRVAGRFLKVRCQRCLGTMHVVGLRALACTPPWQAHSDARPWPGDAAGPNGAVWWAAIGNAPRGPYREDEILELCATADVHARTRMWCAGMHNWERVCESETLAWVYSEVIACSAQGPRADVFGRAALLSDGNGYFPDPTMKSGIILLDEETQKSLAKLVEKQKPKPVGTRAWPSLAAPLAAAVFGALAGASGIAWFIALSA